jgi:hypothetical protein
MRIALWIVFSLVALLWTAGAVLTAAIADWTAAQVASGAAAQAGSTLAQTTLPTWLSPWIDPALVRMAQDALLWTLQTLREALPWAAAAIHWLVPLVWVGWGGGLAVMLLLAALAHLLIGRGASALRGVQGALAASTR